MNAGKSLVRRLLDGAVLVLLAAFALAWAWLLLRPLIPVIVFCLVIYVFLQWRRR